MKCRDAQRPVKSSTILRSKECRRELVGGIPCELEGKEVLHAS